MKNISVIGSGTMGNGIAHVFAQFGYQVCLLDVSAAALEKGMKTIAANLDRQLKKEILTEVDKSAILSRISTFTDLATGAGNADLVIEAASENSNTKTGIFKELDQVCLPSAILASNTSSISITKLAAATRQPERVIGMHFMNPVPVMKLVEVIRGYATDDSVTDSILKLSEGIGKIPVVVQDYPGFVSNRILMPMINEAIYTLFEGVAGVYQIDTVMKLGMAHPMGSAGTGRFYRAGCMFVHIKGIAGWFWKSEIRPLSAAHKHGAGRQNRSQVGRGFLSVATRRQGAGRSKSVY